MDSLKINSRPIRQYKITEGGIDITTFSNPRLPTEECIPFENVRNEKYYYVAKNPMLLILAAVFLLLFILVLIDGSREGASLATINYFTWPSAVILFTVGYFVLQQKMYYLKTFNGKFLKFRITKNESEVAAFVETVIVKRNEQLRLKYGTPNPHLSYDGQFSNFNIMVKEQIISMTEYQEKIEALNKLFNQTKPAQTFGRYSQN